jgi:hypothetical protein
MIICAYCGENYKDCLDITMRTWKADKVVVYSDTDKFGIKMFEPSTDFNESCRRKILIIKRTLEENIGQDVLYLDVDVFMKGYVSNVFKHNYDITVTRMVRRTRFMPEINAGVSFWKSSQNTIDFCDKWLELEKKKQKEKYPEQNAFNELAYEGYDEKLKVKVGNVSENIYNFERDNPILFRKEALEYKPKLIHMKGEKWKDRMEVAFIRNML